MHAFIDYVDLIGAIQEVKLKLSSLSECEINDYTVIVYDNCFFVVYNDYIPKEDGGYLRMLTLSTFAFCIKGNHVHVIKNRYPDSALESCFNKRRISVSCQRNSYIDEE